MYVFSILAKLLKSIYGEKMDSNQTEEQKEFDKIGEKLREWREHLNVLIGVLAFSLAMTSLGTPYPGITAALSLAFIFSVSYSKQHLFPIELLQMRKSPKSDMQKWARIGFEKESFKLVKFLPYWFGIISLVGVILIYRLGK